MANLGPRATIDLVMLTGWDATALQNFTLQDGTTYAEVVSRMNAALAALNAEFQNDWMANMYSVTDELPVRYRMGVSNGYEVHTEYGRPEGKRASVEGHMLPLLAYDRALEWTWDYLRTARMFDIEADIAEAIKDSRDKRRVAILTRCLQNADDSGAAKGLGTGGYSAGFATLAASTSVDFTPPYNEGTTFDSNHQHYVATNASGVFTNGIFEDSYNELREHGHEPPFDFLIGPANRADLFTAGCSDFTPSADALVRVGATQDIANVPSEYLGTIHSFMVREVRGMPQYYGFPYKSYGRLSTRNPLRIRVQKGQSAMNVIAMTDPTSGNGTFPIQNLVTFMEFGVGVADRTAGAPQYNNSGTWADGTPT